MELFAVETTSGASVALVSATTMILLSTLAALSATLVWITRKTELKSGGASVRSAIDVILGRSAAPKSVKSVKLASAAGEGGQVPPPKNKDIGGGPLVRHCAPPGPHGWPVIGSLHLLSSHEVPFEAFSHLSKTYGDIFSITLGSTPCVVVNSFPLIKEVLITKGPHFGGRPNFIRYDILFGGDRDNCKYHMSSLVHITKSVPSTSCFWLLVIALASLTPPHQLALAGFSPVSGVPLARNGRDECTL